MYKVGDKIIVDDPEIVLEKTDALCTHALSSLLHYVLALERGIDPVSLGCPRQKMENMHMLNVSTRASPTPMAEQLFSKSEKSKRTLESPE